MSKILKIQYYPSDYGIVEIRKRKYHVRVFVPENKDCRIIHSTINADNVRNVPERFLRDIKRHDIQIHKMDFKDFYKFSDDKFDRYQNENFECRANYNNLIGKLTRMDVEGFFKIKTIKGIIEELTEDDVKFFNHFVKQKANI